MNFANNLFLILLVFSFGFLCGCAWTGRDKPDEELHVYGCRKWSFCSALKWLKRKWRIDMLFYFHWLKLRKSRKDAMTAAENTI